MKTVIKYFAIFFFILLELKKRLGSAVRHKIKRSDISLASSAPTVLKLVPNALTFAGAAAWPTEVFLRWDMRKV